MADLTLQEQKDKSKQELDVLAAMPDVTKRTEAINQKAQMIADQTGVSIAQIEAGLTEKVEKIVASQLKDPSIQVANFMPYGGQATIGTSFDQKGVSGATASLQTPSLDTKAGSFAGFGNLNMNGEGDLQNGTLGAKYVTPAFKSENFTGVGIAVASVTAPLNGQDFDASNVNATIGAAVWHNQTGISSITTASANGKASGFVIAEDLSKNIYQTEQGTIVAVHGGGAYDVLNSQGNLGAGVMAKTSLGGNLSGWIAADAVVNNVGGTNDPAYMLTLGINGEKPSTNQPSGHATTAEALNAVKEKFQSPSITASNFQADNKNAPLAATIETAKARAATPILAEETSTIGEMSKAYYALEHNEKQQKEFLNDAAKTFAKNSGFEIPVAKQMVQNLFEHEKQHQQDQGVSLN